MDEEEAMSLYRMAGLCVSVRRVESQDEALFLIVAALADKFAEVNQQENQLP